MVPLDTDVVRRRNSILDKMKTLSVLTAGQYTDADYEAAKAEPVILGSQATARWRAPHFVWQVRDELGQILCGTSADACEKIDKGGYTVISTLDYRMQRIVEKWVYAAAIIPNARNVSRLLKNRGIPSSEWSWIRALRGHNLHNAAAGVVDYRTGEILAYAGSASYTTKGGKRFQPQFDVLADGWRQPGSSIKPLGYVIGIDDKTMTAATMFMDVVTNFASGGARPWYPTQADHLERGPVRLRNALQFSLNIPAIKAGFINGLKHQFERTKDFGLRYPKGTSAVPSESIGTLVVHPIDMISAFGTIANGGVLMPRHTILKILDDQGTQVWPARGAKTKGTRVVSSQAAYIMTDILAGNSITSVNPFWGKWRITNGVTSKKVRPAAYKTGTTSDNRDVHAYGYLAPPIQQEAAGPGRGRLAGQLRQLPQRRQAVPRHLRAPVVGDPVRGVQGHADRGLRPREAQGHRDEEGRRVHRDAPGSGLAQDRERALPARVPRPRGLPRWGSSWTSTLRPASAGRMAAWGRRWPRRSSTSRRPKPASRAGRVPTGCGWPAPPAARARAAGRRERGRPTSTAAGSTRSGRPGAAASRPRGSARSPRRRSRRSAYRSTLRRPARPPRPCRPRPRNRGDDGSRRGMKVWRRSPVA